MSQSQTLGSSEIQRKANNVVHLFLVWEQRKIPIKRADINKYVMKDHKSSYAEVMKHVEKKLHDVFGLQLVEIGEAPKKAYILVSVLDQSNSSEMMNWKGNSKRGLLLTVLTLIFMSGNSMSDGTLWNALKGLGIEKDKPHAVFGDVKKLLHQEFARQMYIEVTKVPNCDPPQFNYRWGLRTEHEISKKQILEFVTKLYGKSNIMVWKSQYHDMITSEMQAD
uniref:Melanoma-associated antigen G1 n=1 Tax=Phallusia mammillata TaxID=59560 RepID=A0A6F9DM22_9ASCI|nr:melanoma-associated antigen G1 [Phallusia mammillata]